MHCKTQRMYKSIIRPTLFKFDPEKVHYFTFDLIRNLSKIPGIKGLFRSLYVIEDQRLERELFGLKFKNPVGLAAGFDKNAVLYNELANFGFGFIEIGTVTPKGQIGKLQNMQNILTTKYANKYFAKFIFHIFSFSLSFSVLGIFSSLF